MPPLITVPSLKPHLCREKLGRKQNPRVAPGSYLGSTLCHAHDNMRGQGYSQRAVRSRRVTWWTPTNPKLNGELKNAEAGRTIAGQHVLDQSRGNERALRSSFVNSSNGYYTRNINLIGLLYSGHDDEGRMRIMTPFPTWMRRMVGRRHL